MLESTLTVTPTDEGFDLTLSVRNDSGETVALSFRDAQRAEFVAERTDGDSGDPWRWSDGRAFGMALGGEDVKPGDAVEYTATWPDPASGEYEVRGWLTATDADASAETVVVVE